MNAAPWFGLAVAGGVAIIGGRILWQVCARLFADRRTSQQIRSSQAYRQLQDRTARRGHARG